MQLLPGDTRRQSETLEGAMVEGCQGTLVQDVMVLMAVVVNGGETRG